MGGQKNKKISLIFPVYQESFVLKDISRINKEFQKSNLDWELICLFDSSLEKTRDQLKLVQLPHVKALFYPLFRFGKGFALCYGFKQSKGKFIFFWEGNFSISPKQLLLYINLMDLLNADVVVGSKLHPLSQIYYPPLRRFYSRIYQLIIKLLFGLNVADTQVGLKLYQRRVLEEIIPKIIVKNWGFDLEILVVAHNFGFRRIIEAPIEIKRHFIGKEVTPASVFYLLRDTLAIFYRKYLLKYYQQKFV